MSGGVAGQRRFMIPPGAKEHKLTGVQEIDRDAYLYELNPHMHFRGKYMSYSVQYPDGKEELLLSVPKYDFNWQFNYRLEDPCFYLQAAESSPGALWTTRLRTRAILIHHDRCFSVCKLCTRCSSAL